MLYFATFGLSIPLILRGALNIIMVMNEEVLIWFWVDNYIATLTLLNVIGTFIPIAFQLTSLIFGYIRSK